MGLWGFLKVPTSKSMKIIIIGKGDYWQEAPYDGETWGVNNLILRRRVKRVFDLHKFEKGDDLQVSIKNEANRIGALYINLENYPIDEIKAFFKTDYFSNSIDYMIALAIYEKATSIDLYGVNMLAGDEWAYEKPGVDYWCGQAMGRGIEINNYSPISTIMRIEGGLLYGYLTNQEPNPKVEIEDRGIASIMKEVVYQQEQYKLAVV